MNKPTIENFPKPTKFNDIILMADQIIETVELYPTFDYVFKITDRKEPESNDYPLFCFAGSKIVSSVARLLRRNYFSLLKSGMKISNLNIVCEFKEIDTDVFFLGSKTTHRLYIDNVDIVHVETDKIEDLLLDFDLPCCRAASDQNDNYWISLQCIYSLLTGKYYMPEYISDSITFIDIITQQQPELNNKTATYLFSRLQNRISKYEKRGFICYYFVTDNVLPWLKHRFLYAMTQ